MENPGYIQSSTSPPQKIHRNKENSTNPRNTPEKPSMNTQNNHIFQPIIVGILCFFFRGFNLHRFGIIFGWSLFHTSPKNGSTTHSWALVWRYDQKSLLPSLFVPSVHWQHPPEARIWTNSSTVETRRGLMDKLHRFSCMVQKSQTTSWDIWNPVNNGIFIYIYLPYQLVQNFWTIDSIKRNSRVRLDCQDDLSTTRCLDGSCSGFPRHCSLFKTTEVKRGSVV